MKTRRFLLLGLLALAGCAGGGGVANRRGARYNPGFAGKPWDRRGRMRTSGGGGGFGGFKRRFRRRRR